jgi:hypothetical protein
MSALRAIQGRVAGCFFSIQGEGRPQSAVAADRWNVSVKPENSGV